MKIINSVGGRTTLVCVLQILSVSLCGSRCMLSAQAQKKCFIYIPISLFGCGETLKHCNLFDTMCAHRLFTFPSSLVFECIFYLMLLFFLFSHHPSHKYSRYDLDHNTIFMQNTLLFLSISNCSFWSILPLWIKNNSIFPHFVSHVSFSHIYNRIAYRVNSWANEEL